MASVSINASHSLLLPIRAAATCRSPRKTPVRHRPFSSCRQNLAPIGIGDSRNGIYEWPKTQNPSPYDILHQERTRPYNKRRFTQLVKLYHPDHQSSQILDHSVNYAVRLERFRMLMDAHNLLSDPVRRRAYDEFSLGWPFAKQRAVSANDQQHYDHGHHRDSSQRDDSYSQKKEAMFVRNVSSAVVMLLLIALLSWVQLKRAAKMSRDAALQHLQVHESIVADLQRLYAETSSLNKEDRIKRFLGHRQAMQGM